MSAPRPRPLSVLVLVSALVLGAALRLDGFTERPLYGDEHHTLLESDEGYGVILSTFDTTGSHVVLPLLQKAALDLFGTGASVFRLPALIPGLLMLFLAYPLLSAFVDRRAAVLATIALALSPMHIYYSGFARAYALTMLASVVLAFCVVRALRVPELTRRWVGVGLLAAFTPYAHLSSAGFVACLGIVTIVLAGLGDGAEAGPRFSLRRARPALLAFGGALGLCLLLFAPILGQVRHYLVDVQAVKEEPASWVGIALLIFGGPIPAAVTLGALPFALVSYWRRDRAALLVGATTLVGPVLALMATRPHGMEYAYARYLLSGLPFLLTWLSWGLFSLLRRLVASAATADRIALIGGAALVTLAHLAGPLGPWTVRGEPFGNTYLALRALPAFDPPLPDAPAIYAELAADTAAERIVELPPIYTRAVLLYRNYALIHRKQVTIAFPGPMPRGMQGPPYIRLSELERNDGDYLILHRDPAPEVRRYFRHVYDELVPAYRRWGERGLYERQRATFASNLPRREDMEKIAAGLRNRFGPAYYKDDRVLVWKLSE